MTRCWMAIAMPPPQRGKHCNTITTYTPDDNCPLMCKWLIQSKNSHCYKNCKLLESRWRCAVQLHQLKKFTLPKLRSYNQWKQQKYNKKYKRNVPAAWQLQPYKIHTLTIPHYGLLHGDHTVLVPSGKHPLLYCTPVLYHCTTHTGAGTLHCTQRCRTTVLHTGDVHMWYTRDCCNNVLHTQVLYKY